MSTQQIEQLRSQIDATKSEMMDTAYELEKRVDDLRDWRSTVREYPMVSVAASVGVGLLIGLAAGPAVRGGGRAAGSIARRGVDAGMNALGATARSAVMGVVANELRKRTQ